MGGSTQVLVKEIPVTMIFYLLAYLAFRYSAWIAVVGLVGHGIFDWFHGGLIANPGVPVWWPQFCLTYDVVAGGFLAWRLGWKDKFVLPKTL